MACGQLPLEDPVPRVAGERAECVGPKGNTASPTVTGGQDGAEACQG